MCISLSTYRLRAECLCDALTLLPLLTSRRCLESVTVLPLELGEAEVTLTVRDTSLDDLIAACWQVEGGHVMAQTAQPVVLYTGERDWDRHDWAGWAERCAEEAARLVERRNGVQE